MTTTDEQRTAIWDSIEHWMNNYDDPKNVDASSASCACCQQWFNKSCKGCPIRKFTGRRYCENTPYQTVLAAIDVEDSHFSLADLKDACALEYQFLVDVAFWLESNSTDC